MFQGVGIAQCGRAFDFPRSEKAGSYRRGGPPLWVQHLGGAESASLEASVPVSPSLFSGSLTSCFFVTGRGITTTQPQPAVSAASGGPVPLNPPNSCLVTPPRALLHRNFCPSSPVKPLTTGPPGLPGTIRAPSDNQSGGASVAIPPAPHPVLSNPLVLLLWVWVFWGSDTRTGSHQRTSWETSVREQVGRRPGMETAWGQART